MKSNKHTQQPTRPSKPSMREVFAQVYHFIYYIEDLAATPKGLRHNVDTRVIKKKCDQVKAMLEAAN